MTLIDDLLATYHRPQNAARPAPMMAAGRPTAILTCMDARIDPARLLGPAGKEGPLIAVIRNAGGRASDDAVRSLIVATRLKGVRHLLVAQHTDCAMLTFTNAEMLRRLADETGDDVAGFDFLPITTLEQSVRSDVAAITALPFFAGRLTVAGFIYDIETGRLHPVTAEPHEEGVSLRAATAERRALLRQLARATDQLSEQQPSNPGGP